MLNTRSIVARAEELLVRQSDPAWQKSPNYKRELLRIAGLVRERYKDIKKSYVLAAKLESAANQCSEQDWSLPNIPVAKELPGLGPSAKRGR